MFNFKNFIRNYRFFNGSFFEVYGKKLPQINKETSS